ncbi:glycosyltransferase [Pseudarthrobacter sp. S9]|uniref:glycosyltransferase n=1 Tax=Pseudarthrobacter sp. S9 TaxID=3418421 RepID=UPI003D0746C3
MNNENVPEYISFFTVDGNEFLRHRYEGSSIISIELKRKKRGSFIFRDEKELLAYWLSEHVFSDAPHPTLISEYGFNRTALEGLKKSIPGLRVIYTLHNNHLAAPYRYGSKIKPELQDFMDHLAEYDAVVVLTDEQRIDIMKQFAPLANIHVIPHHVPDFPSISATRDPMKVVLVGRYTSIKGQLDAIEAFREVSTRFPQATLELYGRGPDEEEIRKAIGAAGLVDQVRIMGFTDNSLATFEGAALSLQPSYMEGYALSLQESMASGCVPVAYDFKYGARAQITNGEDGILVDTGNIRELAAAIILLLSDPKYLMTLSSAARNCKRSSTQQQVVQSWGVLFRNVRSEVESNLAI